MHYDVIVRHARLHRREGQFDIAVKDGQFARIEHELPSDTAVREIEANCNLVVPPFIDSHVHLDAVLTELQGIANRTSFVFVPAGS